MGTCILLNVDNMNAKNKVNLNLIPDGERSGLFLFHKLTQSYLGKSFGLGPELG